MPRVTDLGITLGLLPAGPAGSVLDAPGAGLGHATVWRDEPSPPAGRGVARTGVTVLDPGGDLFSAPVPAGGAVLNGAGECTGLLTAQEWGLAESPVFLTSTMQLGRVYDAACELLIEEQPAIGSADVIIPVVAECDDSFLNDCRRMQVSAAGVRQALAAARAPAGGTAAEGAVGAGTGMSCLGYKGGTGTASRVLPSGAFLALATGLRTRRGQPPTGTPVTGAALDSYLAAVTEATEEAVLNSMLEAATVTGRDGNISYQLPAGQPRELTRGRP
jgi:D-aminopeptidase